MTRWNIMIRGHWSGTKGVRLAVTGPGGGMPVEVLLQVDHPVGLVVTAAPDVGLVGNTGIRQGPVELLLASP